MALPGIAPIGELGELDRSLLYLFVAGPGEGEGIAIALPGAGWILVDGCRSQKKGRPDRFPLEKLVRTFANGDRVELMVLTHPHRDHVHGFAELLETLPPRRVGVVGVSEPMHTIVDEVDELVHLRKTASTGDALRAGAVLTALRAIDTWVDAGGTLLGLNDGTKIEYRDVGLLARAPDPGYLAELVEQGAFGKACRTRTNSLSCVLELQYRSTRVVLGGDLPVRDHGGEIPSGWNLVMRRHKHLGYHHALKVPHHGSKDALHADLVGPFATHRAWVLTPYNSSSLPCTDEDDGLDLLLRGQSPVMLTAMSLSKRFQVAQGQGRVTPRQLERMGRALKKGGTFTDEDSTYRTGTALDALDPVWCVALDDRSNIVGRWRGNAALEVWHQSPQDGNDDKPASAPAQRTRR